MLLIRLILLTAILESALAQLPIRAGGGTGGSSGTSAVASTVSFSTTPIFVVPTSTIWVVTITLTNNVSSSTVDTTAATVGQDTTFNICQNSLGPWTFAWPSNFTGTVTVQPYINTCSIQNFTWNGTNFIASKGGMICPACPIGLTISNLKLTDVATGTQCLHANSTGLVSGFGADCGGAGLSDPGANGFVSRTALNTTNYVQLGSIPGHLYITGPQGDNGHTTGFYLDPLFTMTSPVTVTSTSEATLIGAGLSSNNLPGTNTLPANLFLGTGWTLLIESYGRLSTTAVPGTQRIRFKLGSTVILDTGAYALVGGITNAVYHLRTLITARTVGASGTLMAQSIFETTGSALIPNEAKMLNTTAITIDTTATQVMDFTNLFDTASNSITNEIFIVRLF